MNGIVHLAGQIGLVPGTMQLVEGGAEAEAARALRGAKALSRTLTLRATQMAAMEVALVVL